MRKYNLNSVIFFGAKQNIIIIILQITFNHFNCAFKCSAITAVI